VARVALDRLVQQIECFDITPPAHLYWKWAEHLLIGSYTTIPSVFLLNARLPSSGVMHLDLSDEETLALLNLLTQTI
jgi:hypothetical protein